MRALRSLHRSGASVLASLARWGEAAGSSGWFIWVPLGRASWFLWPQSAHAATRRARGGRAAEASAHILKVDVPSAVDQLTDLRVAPVKCGIEQVGHLRALFREPLC